MMQQVGRESLTEMVMFEERTEGKGKENPCTVWRKRSSFQVERASQGEA